jgi:hypothetical protein
MTEELVLDRASLQAGVQDRPHPKAQAVGLPAANAVLNLDHSSVSVALKGMASAMPL